MAKQHELPPPGRDPGSHPLDPARSADQPGRVPDPLRPHEGAREVKEVREKGTHVVTFPGQPPVTVTAGSDEEAVKKAAEQLGVVSSERPPEVVKVQ